MNATATQLTAIPFMPTPQRAAIVSHIIRNVAHYETLFTDYARICDERCAETRELPQMCAACQTRIASINRMLLDPYSRTWEVWGEDALPIGILYLTNVIPGGDALAHYLFFDADLRGKSDLIESIIQWCFEDHPTEGWVALRRMTVEVPSYAFALARHASRYLGFSGPFKYTRKGISLPVEGVKSNALVWRGAPHDILILGRLA